MAAMKNAIKTTLAKIKATIEEKGEAIALSDFLKPELEYIIRVSNLSYEDGKLARMYFLQGKKAVAVMEENEWFSTSTFTRHKKMVAAKLLDTARRIAKM